MKLCVVGVGYVGLVTGACLADLGNQVICIDKDKKKITGLEKGNPPFYEPGLKEIVNRNIRNKRLVFSADLAKAALQAEIIFIAVGTPPKESGEADVSAIIEVAKGIAKALRKKTTPGKKGRVSFKLIVNKIGGSPR